MVRGAPEKVAGSGFHNRGAGCILKLIMRKARQNSRRSEEPFSLEHAQKLISELVLRVEKLENQAFWDGMRARFQPPAKRSKGRPPRIPEDELLDRRKNLSSWIEFNWPEVSVRLRNARSSVEALAAMVSAKERSPGAFQPPFYHTIEQHESALWQFLQSGRFYGNPKNLASAMAGLPELSWKRSFDICCRYPDKGCSHLHAYWDYMRRNFPDRLRELSTASSTDEVKAILAKSRTQDPVYQHLKANPDKVLDWLAAGKPSLE